MGERSVHAWISASGRGLEEMPDHKSARLEITFGHSLDVCGSDTADPLGHSATSRTEPPVSAWRHRSGPMGLAILRIDHIRDEPRLGALEFAGLTSCSRSVAITASIAASSASSVTILGRHGIDTELADIERIVPIPGAGANGLTAFKNQGAVKPTGL